MLTDGTIRMALIARRVKQLAKAPIGIGQTNIVDRPTSWTTGEEVDCPDRRTFHRADQLLARQDTYIAWGTNHMADAMTKPNPTLT